MADFLTIQTRVTRRVIDLPPAVTAEVPTLVNEAMRELQDEHNFKVMEAATAQLLTAQSTHTLAAVPSDYKEARGKPYEVLFDGSTRDLVHAANIQAVLDRFTLNDLNDIGAPGVILDGEPTDVLNARSFEFYPFSDGNSDWGDGEYRVVIPYWRFVPALSGDGDTNWFTNNAEKWLTFRATAEAFALDWDEERSIFWDARAAAEKNRVVNRDKLYRLGGVGTLAPHKDVNTPKLRG